MTGSTPVGWAPDLHEIIWIDHDPAEGHEIDQRHPMLVLSTKLFAERTGIVIGLPMTHSDSHSDNPFALKITGTKKAVAYILCHQPKSFDWRERQAAPHLFGKASAAVVHDAKKLLAQILGM